MKYNWDKQDKNEDFPYSIDLKCGNKGYFDRSSGCAYRCDSCFAVIGSVGQPNECRDEQK